jgi:predicted dehydrogenase
MKDTMINVAIVSLGSISALHIEGYLQFPGRCAITRLVGIDPAKAEQKRQEYNWTKDTQPNFFIIRSGRYHQCRSFPFLFVS